MMPNATDKGSAGKPKAKPAKPGDYLERRTATPAQRENESRKQTKADLQKAERKIKADIRAYEKAISNGGTSPSGPGTTPSTGSPGSNLTTLKASLAKAQKQLGDVQKKLGAIPAAKPLSQVTSITSDREGQVGLARASSAKPSTGGAAPAGGATFNNGLDAMIVDAAAKHGIDPRILAAIVKVESGGNINVAVGDQGRSFGIVQINRKAHPDISEAQATDPAWALDYAAKRIANFKKSYPNAPTEALLLQHNAPAAAESLAKGRITVAQANAKSGTGRYITETMAAFGQPLTLSGTPGGGQASGGTGVTTAAAGGGTAIAGPTLNGKPVDLKKASDATLLEYAKTNYPQYAGYLGIPELRAVVFRSLRETWNDNTLAGAVFGTTWWKTTAPTIKAWTNLKATDPAAHAQREKQTKEGIIRQAQVAGVTLSAGQVNDLSDKMNRLGWTPDQVTTAIAGQFKVGKQAPTGTGGGVVANLKGMADEYLVKLSDTTLSQWSQMFLAGTANEATFKAYLVAQAKSLYPMLSAPLDAGISVRQYAEPYVQDAASLWEVPPDSINLNDPKFLAAFGKVDGKTGERQVMSRGEWSDYLRAQPEYKRTKQAVGQAAQVAEGLGQMFGMTA